MTKVTQEQLDLARAAHGTDIGEHKDKNAKIKISKDKKSQAVDSVNNILVITNDVKHRKYAVSLNATVINTDGEKVTVEDPYLAELQERFCLFLSELKADVVE